MNNQERLSELLKKKGIGPEGSKSLKREELADLKNLFQDPEVSMTTKATMLTALLTLSPTSDEKIWIDNLKQNPTSCLPPEFLGFINETSDRFLSIIKKIISHTDLDESESREAMGFFFNEKTPDHLKASFLEGERLKRETFTENKIFLESLYNKIPHTEVKTSLLIDICDSYDGSNRSGNYSLFTAALLASAGYPTYLHGIDEVAPKLGYTSHQILKTAQKNPLISIEKAVQQLEDPGVGWAYLDQQIFFSDLYKLKKMRKEMVKRPFLATFEKLLQPLRIHNGNLIVTGFTHPHYKEELVKQLKHQGACKQALILKGVEGSTHMSLNKNTTCIHFNGEESKELVINPSGFNLPVLEAKQDRNITAKYVLDEALAALKGEKNYARENILYLAITILTKFELIDLAQALQLLQKNLDSGKAFLHWEKGNN